MFWKRSRPGSLALRLSVWYACSAFLLLLAGTGFLYWELVQSANQEDDQYLSEKINTIGMLLRENDFRTLNWEVRASPQCGPRSKYCRGFSATMAAPSQRPTA